MTIWLTWLFNFTWPFIFMCGSLGLPCYVTLIYNGTEHNSDAAEMTHDMTWHNNASMFMLLVVSMSSHIVVEWWMCSCCIIASPLHDKACRVFDGLGVCLMFSSACSSFTCTLIGFIFSSIRKQIFLHAFHVHQFVNKSPRIHPICSRVMYHPCTCIHNHSWWEDIKSINILIYHDVLSFAFECKWPGERTRLLKLCKVYFKLGCGLQELPNENFIEVTWRLGWIV